MPLGVLSAGVTQIRPEFETMSTPQLCVVAGKDAAPAAPPAIDAVVQIARKRAAITERIKTAIANQDLDGLLRGAAELCGMDPIATADSFMAKK